LCAEGSLRRDCQLDDYRLVKPREERPLVAPIQRMEGVAPLPAVDGLG